MPQFLPITLQPPELGRSLFTAAPAKPAPTERRHPSAGNAESPANEPIGEKTPSFADRLSERIDTAARTDQAPTRDAKPAEHRTERAPADDRRPRTDEVGAAQESDLDAHETRTDPHNRTPDQPRPAPGDDAAPPDVPSRESAEPDLPSTPAPTGESPRTADSEPEGPPPNTNASLTLELRAAPIRSAPLPEPAAAPSKPAAAQPAVAHPAAAAQTTTETSGTLDTDATGETPLGDQPAVANEEPEPFAPLAFVQPRSPGSAALAPIAIAPERTIAARQSRSPATAPSAAVPNAAPEDQPVGLVLTPIAADTPDNQQQPSPQNQPRDTPHEQSPRTTPESNSPERAHANAPRPSAGTPPPGVPTAHAEATLFADHGAPAPQPVAAIGVPQSTSQRSPSIAQASPRASAKTADTDPAAAAVARGLSAVVNQKGGSLTIRLTPETLGFVRVNMELSGGSVSARIEASTPAAQELLNANLGMLKQSLESRGLSVERLHVELALQPAPGAPQNNPGSSGNAPSDGRAGSQGFSHDAAGGRSRGHTGEGRDPRNPRSASPDFEPDPDDRSFTARLDFSLNAVA